MFAANFREMFFVRGPLLGKPLRTRRPGRRWLAASVTLLIIAVVLCFLSRPLTGANETITLAFVGDIMLDSLPGEAVANGEDPFAAFANILSSADLAIGNLECVVATLGKRVDKPYTFRAHPRVLPLLSRYFGALSLANNHTGDFGHDAFREQLDLLKQHKLPYFGGGRNLVEAHAPLILERKGIRIALLGYNDFQPRWFEAGPTWPGIAWGVDEQMAADVKAARAIHKADLVIPYLHWGWEVLPPNARQKEMAQLLIDNGADLVVGGHPHVTQGAEFYKGKPIIYSLGNFLFDGFTTNETNTGWLLRVRLDRSGVVEWDTALAHLDERGLPHLVPHVPSPYAAAGSHTISERPFAP